MRRAVAAVAVLALAAPALATERPNIVLLDAVEGIATLDSSAAAAFAAGVREAFEADVHLTEGTTAGMRRVSMALSSTFRAVHGEPFGDEWRVRLSVSTDSLPRLPVRIEVRPPDGWSAGARPTRVAEELSLDAPVGPRAAWFAGAGRAAGLLAVEALHRRSGDLAPDTRVRIDHAARRAIATPPSIPGR